MNARFSKLFVAFLFLLAATPAMAAQDNWVGRRFMPRAEAQFKAGSQVVSTFSLPLYVDRVQGDWLWVGNAWVLKRHVVPLESAEGYYSELLRRDRQDHWAWNLRGLTRAWNVFLEMDISLVGDYESALRDLSEAIRLRPSEAMYYADRAWVYDNDWNRDAANRDYTQAIRLQPNNASYYADRAKSYFLGAPEDDEAAFRDYQQKAIRDYTEAIRLAPQAAEYYADRAEVREVLGDDRGYVEDMLQAIQVDPNNAEYHLDLAMHVFYSWTNVPPPAEEIDLVIHHASEAIRLKGDDDYPGGAYSIRGKAYRRKGDLAQAAADFREALRDALKLREEADLSFGGYDEYRDLGNVLVEMGDFAEALPNFSAMVKLEPKRQEARFLRAEALRQLGREEEAAAEYTQTIQLCDAVLKKYPDWQVSLMRGRSKAGLRDFAGAIADYNTVFELASAVGFKGVGFNEPELLLLRGAAYVETHQYEAALADLHRAKELNPELAPQVDPWIARAVREQSEPAGATKPATG
jgi:tetratricopeptide (TPR) repeat protein